MAVRPIYISTGDMDVPFVKEDINFKWVKGTSYKQKCLRRDELGKEISKLYDIKKWLEVSTKSDKDIGIKLSALNLMLETNIGRKISVEDIYQMSKIKDNGKIVGFKFGSSIFPNIPYGMYYDYIYLCALYQNKDYHSKIDNYNIFSDIEFNPNRQINTQARAVSLFKTLYDNNELDIIISREDFKKYYKKISK